MNKNISDYLNANNISAGGDIAAVVRACAAQMVARERGGVIEMPAETDSTWKSMVDLRTSAYVSFLFEGDLGAINNVNAPNDYLLVAGNANLFGVDKMLFKGHHNPELNAAGTNPLADNGEINCEGILLANETTTTKVVNSHFDGIRARGSLFLLMKTSLILDTVYFGGCAAPYLVDCGNGTQSFSAHEVRIYDYPRIQQATSREAGTKAWYRLRGITDGASFRNCFADEGAMHAVDAQNTTVEIENFDVNIAQPEGAAGFLFDNCKADIRGGVMRSGNGQSLGVRPGHTFPIPAIRALNGSIVNVSNLTVLDGADFERDATSVINGVDPALIRII